MPFAGPDSSFAWRSFRGSLSVTDLGHDRWISTFSEKSRNIREFHSIGRSEMDRRKLIDAWANETIRSYTIVTTTPNAVLMPGTARRSLGIRYHGRVDSRE